MRKRVRFNQACGFTADLCVQTYRHMLTHFFLQPTQPSLDLAICLQRDLARVGKGGSLLAIYLNLRVATPGHGRVAAPHRLPQKPISYRTQTACGDVELSLDLLTQPSSWPSSMGIKCSLSRDSGKNKATTLSKVSHALGHGGTLPCGFHSGHRRLRRAQHP